MSLNHGASICEISGPHESHEFIRHDGLRRQCVGTTRLYRSTHGERIHLPTCRYAAIPWLWAQDEVDEDIATIPWLSPCQRCKPYVKAALPTPSRMGMTGEAG